MWEYLLLRLLIDTRQGEILSERNPHEARLMRVFVAAAADDSVVIREHLIRLLAEIAGLEVIGQAQNAAEALSGLCRLEPDVAILDIQMSGGNGIQVLQKIKRQQPAIIVMMLTSYAYPQYRQKCMEYGADFFFDKAQGYKKLKEVFTALVEDFIGDGYGQIPNQRAARQARRSSGRLSS